MKINRYIHLWLPIIGLHALHQVEESIAPLFWNLKRIQQNYITALKAEVYGNK